jgi:hypothetical protein
MPATTATATSQASAPVLGLEAPEHTDGGNALNTNIDGSEPTRLHVVPTFKDKNEERTWAKQQMAGAFRIFAKLGYADGASGHISLRGLCPTSFMLGE